MSAIEAQDLSKVYRLYHSPQDRLKEWLSLGGRKYHHEFFALRDISLTVQPGETIGIIGQNGSGKSTLLKILTGVIRSTSGRVQVNGRISSLLELGAGFHADFSGRDNVYINGSLMGYSRKEMDHRFPDIEAFADIGEYIDQPVRTYSSGMYMRLAFSAAINVEPDILIIDEILAVGDENFLTKCHKKIQDLRQSGTTILLVSHDTFTIENICNKAYLLDHGRCISEGTPADVIPRYKSIVHAKSAVNQAKSNQHDAGNVGATAAPREFKRWGTKDVEITNVYFVDSNGKRIGDLRLEPNGMLAVRIEFVAYKRIDRPVFGIAIHRNDGVDIIRTNTKMSGLELSSIEEEGVIEYTVDRLPLLPGQFTFTAAVSDYDVFVAYDLWYKCLSFTVSESATVKERGGVVNLDSRWSVLGKT